MSPSSGSADAECHFAASGLAAIINFPLWRASAIAQSGFKLEGSNFIVRYYRSVMQPPYRGVTATIVGMTWARGMIFYGSEYGKRAVNEHGVYGPVAYMLPPLILGIIVQVVNMPLVRATVTIQDPSCTIPSVTQALIQIYDKRGFFGLWHGVSAGIMKTVPKYMTAVGVKDLMEARLPHADPADKNAVVARSAIKSIAAGVAGAALTNPLDVLRNEMFKTDLSLVQTLRSLLKSEGWAFMSRGMTSNMTAVAIPIAVTIFTTDQLISLKRHSLR